MTARPHLRRGTRAHRGGGVLLVLATLAILVVGLVGASPALAADSGVEKARAELAQSRVKVDQALDLARAGDRDEAYDARAQRLPRPLRVRRGPAAPARPEPRARHRVQVRRAAQRDPRAASRRRCRDTTSRAVRGGLARRRARAGREGRRGARDRVRLLVRILFREGVEAVLLIAILLGSLAAGSAANYKRPLGWGVAGARSSRRVTCGSLTTLVLDIAPVNRELLEAITALVAVVVLVAVSFWLVSRLEHRRRMEFMRARIAGAIAAGTPLPSSASGSPRSTARASRPCSSTRRSRCSPRGSGSTSARRAHRRVALGGVGYAILGLGRKLPLKPLLIAGASMLLLLRSRSSATRCARSSRPTLLGATPVAPTLRGCPSSPPS